MAEHLYKIIVKLHYSIIVQIWIFLHKQVVMLWTKTSPQSPTLRLCDLFLCYPFMYGYVPSHLLNLQEWLKYYINLWSLLCMLQVLPISYSLIDHPQ